MYQVLFKFLSSMLSFHLYFSFFLFSPVILYMRYDVSSSSQFIPDFLEFQNFISSQIITNISTFCFPFVWGRFFSRLPQSKPAAFLTHMYTFFITWSCRFAKHILSNALGFFFQLYMLFLSDVTSKKKHNCKLDLVHQELKNVFIILALTVFWQVNCDDFPFGILLFLSWCDVTIQIISDGAFEVCENWKFIKLRMCQS